MKSFDQMSLEIAYTIINAFDEQEIDSKVSLISSVIVFKRVCKDLKISKTKASEILKEVWHIDD